MTHWNKVYIEITNICNLHCSFCPPTKRKPQQMPLDKFEQLLQQLKPYTNQLCLHVKGEPLLHHEFGKVLKLCEEYQYNVSLTTNGIFLNKWLKEVKESKALKKIHISLTCENEIPNYVKKVMLETNQLKEEQNVIYRLWALKDGKMTEKTKTIILQIADFYHLKEETIEEMYCQKNSKIAKGRYIDKGMLFEWPTLGDKTTHSFCQGLSKQIAILVDGTVVPCCLDGEGMIKLGNVFEQPLEQIINTNRYQEMKRAFQNNLAKEKLCQNCTYKNRFKS